MRELTMQEHEKNYNLLRIFLRIGSVTVRKHRYGGNRYLVVDEIRPPSETRCEVWPPTWGGRVLVPDKITGCLRLAKNTSKRKKPTVQHKYFAPEEGMDLSDVDVISDHYHDKIRILPDCVEKKIAKLEKELARLRKLAGK